MDEDEKARSILELVRRHCTITTANESNVLERFEEAGVDFSNVKGAPYWLRIKSMRRKEEKELREFKEKYEAAKPEDKADLKKEFEQKKAALKEAMDSIPIWSICDSADEQ
ncbi:MAG: hypothetical protein ACLPX5_06185 [Dissulfurispiraceae bacterium]